MSLAEIGTLAREIVAKRLAVTAAVTALVTTAVSLHWVTPGVSEDVDTWLTRGLDLLALILGATWARCGVTPADPDLAPTSSHGLPMIETGNRPDAPP